MGAQIYQTLLSLVFVLALIGVCAYLYKRFYFMPQSRHSLLSIKASLNLGVKEKVILIACGDQYFLLGVTAEAIRLLHCFEPSATFEHNRIEPKVKDVIE